MVRRTTIITAKTTATASNRVVRICCVIFHFVFAKDRCLLLPALEPAPFPTLECYIRGHLPEQFCRAEVQLVPGAHFAFSV